MALLGLTLELREREPVVITDVAVNRQRPDARMLVPQALVLRSDLTERDHLGDGPSRLAVVHVQAHDVLQESPLGLSLHEMRQASVVRATRRYIRPARLSVLIGFHQAATR